MSFAKLQELKTIHDGGGVRIPPDKTVPLTPRVRRLLDSSPVRRMAAVRQLGLVSLVYPGAVHSRLEHSLGVYRLSLEYSPFTRIKKRKHFLQHSAWSRCIPLGGGQRKQQSLFIYPKPSNSCTNMDSMSGQSWSSFYLQCKS